MLDLSKKKLVRTRVRIHNPTDDQLVVWIEPWADRLDLAPNASMEIVFVGPRDGLPEFLPRPGALSIYAWEGAEAFAIQDGQFMTSQPSLDEIVRQELEIAQDQAVRLDAVLPTSEILFAQHSLDSIPPFQSEFAEDICKISAHFIHCLTEVFEPSSNTTALMWRIAQRMIGTKGFLLATANPKNTNAAIWSDMPSLLIKLIGKSVVPILGVASKESSNKARRRAADSESDLKLS